MQGITSPTPEAGYLLDRGDEIWATHEDETQRYQRLTVETAMRDGLNPVLPVYIVTNESHWNPKAVGDHGLARNLAQFHPLTFLWMKKKANMPNLEYENPQDQIILMEWGVKNGYGDNWSTYRRYYGIK